MIVQVVRCKALHCCENRRGGRRCYHDDRDDARQHDASTAHELKLDLCAHVRLANQALVRRYLCGAGEVDAQARGACPHELDAWPPKFRLFLKDYLTNWGIVLVK